MYRKSLLRNIVSEVVCGFIPGKKAKHRARYMLRYGVFNYLKAAREEKSRTFEDFLSVAAIAKNEGPYLAEWIDFHRLVGVDRFYIYDNNSTDSTRKVLAPFIDEGVVIYRRYPGEKMQYKAYNDAVGVCASRTKWLAMIDIDEFIVPVSTETVPDFLRKLPEEAVQLTIGWIVYGSSGHRTRPEGPVTASYKHRARENKWMKSIANPRFVVTVASAHRARVAGPTVDEHHNRIVPVREMELTTDKIRINHYFCKSLEEYRLKRARGSAVRGPLGLTDETVLKMFEKADVNEVYDPIMDRYAEPLAAAASARERARQVVQAVQAEA